MKREQRAVLLDPALNDLVERTNKRDATGDDRHELRRYLQQHRVMWGELGTIAHLAIERTVGMIGNGLAEEVTLAGVETLKIELGYNQSPTIERLLIENVVLAWLVFNHTQSHYAGWKAVGGTTFKQDSAMEDRLERAQRRYLRAVETLARVRKMKLPPLQINVGGVQTITTNTTVSPTEGR